MIALFVVLLLDIARSSTVTVDEFADVPAGLAALRAGDFALDARNPPLLKMTAALPAAVAGARLPAAGWRRPEAGWWPWIHGTRFLVENRARYGAFMLAARATTVLLAAALGGLVFVWSRRLHGPTGGIASLLLFVFSPTVLAHGSLATLDLGAALFFFAAAWAFDRHTRRRSWTSLVACGVLVGAALASKFSTLVLVPAAAFLLVPGASGSGVVARARDVIARALVAAVAALALLQLVYGLPGLTRLADVRLRSAPLRAAQGFIGGLPLPLPPELVAGVDDALAYARDPEIPGYLNGAWSKEGWWYYHLEAFVIKEPLPLLGLLLAASAVVLRARDAGRLLRTPALWLPPALLVLSLLTWNKVQYGLRYLLPAYPFLFVAAGSLGRLARSAVGRAALVAGFGTLAAATLSVHPHELSSFNALVGGPERGWRYLADSNVDWGQDLAGLARLLREKWPGRTVRLAYFGHVDPDLYGIRYEVLRGREDAHGLLAVSASFLAGEPYAITWRGALPEAVPGGVHAWLGAERPVGRVGYSIYLYELP